MEKNSVPKYEGTEWKWYFGLPFMRKINKGARDYYKDRETYELSLMLESQKVRYRQSKTIYELSAILIMIVTSLWTSLPSIFEATIGLDWDTNSLTWLSWMKMGIKADSVSWINNWPAGLAMLIVPGTGGAVIHKLPKWTPKKMGVVLDAILKILPIIILIFCYYLIKTQNEYNVYKKFERENLLKQVVLGEKSP